MRDRHLYSNVVISGRVTQRISVQVRVSGLPVSEAGGRVPSFVHGHVAVLVRIRNRRPIRRSWECLLTTLMVQSAVREVLLGPIGGLAGSGFQVVFVMVMVVACGVVWRTRAEDLPCMLGIAQLRIRLVGTDPVL